MNFWLFGLFYLIYTLFLIIVGVVLLKRFGKNFIYKYYENKLEKYFDSYDEESDEIEKVYFDN